MYYTRSTKFRLNYLEYKNIFNFVAIDFEKLGIDFVWDRTGRASESTVVEGKDNYKLLIKDSVCMYKELIDQSVANFNLFTILYEPTVRNRYYDCYFGSKKDENFAFELSFAKTFHAKRMFLITENETVIDVNHPKIYWIKKDFTFIDKSLVKLFLKRFESVFLRIQGDDDYKLFSPYIICNRNIKQITLSGVTDFYEINKVLVTDLSYVLAYQDFNKNYFVYVSTF